MSRRPPIARRALAGSLAASLALHAAAVAAMALLANEPIVPAPPRTEYVEVTILSASADPPVPAPLPETSLPPPATSAPQRPASPTPTRQDLQTRRSPRPRPPAPRPETPEAPPVADTTAPVDVQDPADLRDPASAAAEPSAAAASDDVTVTVRSSSRAASGRPAAGQARPAGPYAEGDVDQRPRLIAEAKPRYPESALRLGVEGDVTLALIVDASGRVTEARVTRSAGHGFDEAALQTARRLRFSPALKGGAAVSVRVTWTCRFRIEE